VERGAIGLVTTHDWRCGHRRRARASGPPTVHRNHIEDGRMVFDYAMRPGVVRKSNASS